MTLGLQGSVKRLNFCSKLIALWLNVGLRKANSCSLILALFIAEKCQNLCFYACTLLVGAPEHYLDALERVRQQSLKGSLELNDDRLHLLDAGRKTPTSNDFKWFYVFEDELEHRGQIRLIRRILPDNL